MSEGGNRERQRPTGSVSFSGWLHSFLRRRRRCCRPLARSLEPSFSVPRHRASSPSIFHHRQSGSSRCRARLLLKIRSAATTKSRKKIQEVPTLRRTTPGSPHRQQTIIIIGCPPDPQTPREKTERERERERETAMEHGDRGVPNCHCHSPRRQGAHLTGQSERHDA